MNKTPTSQDIRFSEETLPGMALNRAALYTGHPVLREKRQGIYRDIDWREFSGQVMAYARGLLALDITPGDKVAIMAPNSPAWVYADLAIQACGAVSVPVYHTEGLQNILYILDDAECRQLFVWSPLVAKDLLQHLEDIPKLEKLILIRGEVDHPQVLPLAGLINSTEPGHDKKVNRRIEELAPEALASIVYTSGTTGPPKGAMLSHRNFLSNVRGCIERFDINATDTCLSFLPLSHVFERMAGYYLMLHQGTTIAYAESIDTVPSNMLEVRPTVMISVPRLYEKMFNRVMERVIASPWPKRKLFFGALRLCKRLVALEQAGDRPPGWLKLLADLARKSVFVKLRAPLGGRLRFFVSGGAPLAPEVAEFFIAAGIPIYEGYGLTETSPVIAANTAQHQRLGTVGQPLSGTSVEIASDGEILVSGPGIFQGYWNKPEQTREALKDGWFHTGDIGELDPDGYLSITDRKKDLIVTASGENIAPLVIEKRLKTDKFILNIMVYGDRRPYLTALVVPNFDNLERYARMKKIDFLTHCDLVNHPEILGLMRRRIEKYQAEDPGFKKIKRFTLISRDFNADTGEITPTLKIKRKVVAQRYRQILDNMYLARDHGIHDTGFCIIDDTAET